MLKWEKKVIWIIVVNGSQSLMNSSIYSYVLKSIIFIYLNYAKPAVRHHWLQVFSLIAPTLWSWQWGRDPATIESVTGIKWASELPDHHTIISIVWRRVARNLCALTCNIWWVSEVFSVKPGSVGPPLTFSRSSRRCPLHFQRTGHLQCINDTSHHEGHVACQTSDSLGLN